MNTPEGGIARPLILLSNDDGVGAMGLEALISIVRDLGDVIVVAPEGGAQPLPRSLAKFLAEEGRAWPSRLRAVPRR